MSRSLMFGLALIALIYMLFLFPVWRWFETGQSSSSAQAQAQAQDSITPGRPTYIRIFKAEKTLELWQQPKGSKAYTLAASFPICAFSGKLGPKIKEGDHQAPEGFYSITRGRLNPNSAYHLAMNVGYPNAYDRANGYTGSYIMIHGNCVSVGCFAMTDAGIEPIYQAVEAALNAGQSAVPVHIFPFRLSANRLPNTANSPHHDFWAELAPAYDVFERRHIPPTVTVQGKSYVVSP